MGGSTSHLVLIVEDEWLVRMELADAFAGLGFTVLEGATAEHAIDLLHAHPGISLLVTDIRLGGLADGWELAIQVRTAKPDIPVIYLSANPPMAERIVEGGVFIDKPARMEQVTAIAMELLGKSG